MKRHEKINKNKYIPYFRFNLLRNQYPVKMTINQQLRNICIHIYRFVETKNI